jgi:hypothetical protein
VSGCAIVNDKAMRLFSSKVSAVAIVNAQLLQGDLVFTPDRTGTLSLAGANGPIANCSGQVRYTGTTSGAIDLRCNDGSAAELQFSLLSETRGYAYGQTATHVASLAFGLPAAQAQSYLKVPSDKRLVVRGADGALELQ